MHHAIIWTNADILSIGPQGTYFNEILLEIQIFSFQKMHLNMTFAKWWPFCPGGDNLRVWFCLALMTAGLYAVQWNINKLKPQQNGHYFLDYIFKGISLNESVSILIKISWNFVPKDLINSILALVEIMAWHRPGDHPLSEPMMVSLLMHICSAWPQWVNCAIMRPNNFYCPCHCLMIRTHATT